MPHRVGKRVQRVADQPKNLLDADALKHADQNIRDCLSHLFLRHALSAIAFFSAIPRAFYHAANVLGLDFLTHAVNNKAQQATRRFRRWVNRY
jgi:hypothetical protein